jgi:hypothetical protein
MLALLQGIDYHHDEGVWRCRVHFDPAAMEGRAQQRLDEQITPPDARLRDEPEIVQAPGLLDDERNHAEQGLC